MPAAMPAKYIIHTCNCKEYVDTEPDIIFFCSIYWKIEFLKLFFDVL